jgi:hypothetical protein
MWAAAVATSVVLVALAARGLAPGRTVPAAAFALLWLAAAMYAVVARWALRRRAARLRTAELPRGIVLRKPIWIPLRDGLQLVAAGAAVAAAVSLVGFPSVGLGIVLTMAAMGIFFTHMGRDEPAFQFEPSGLRLHLRRGAQCVLPWTDVVSVATTEATRSHIAWVDVEVANPIAVFASLVPDTPKARTALWLLFALGKPNGRALKFHEWSGGVDAPTLARAIREATGRAPPASEVN